MTTRLPMLCFACARLRPVTEPDTGTPMASTCEAFPNGIPMSMGLGGDHRESLPGDNGLRFLQADGPDAAEAFASWQRFSAVTPAL